MSDRFAIVAALLAALALVAFGCGDDEETVSNGNSQDVFHPNVITDSDIAAQEEGSPGKALLEWWQAMQFADAATAASLTSEEVLDELGEDDFTDLVVNRGPGLQGVEVLEVTENEDEATLRVGMLSFQPEEPGDPPPDEPTSSNPKTFVMTNQDGDWVFAGTDFLAPMIEALKKAQRQEKQEN